MPGQPQLPMFRGGPPELRDKLNRIAEFVNAALQISGDDNYINVNHSPLGGMIISLNVHALATLIRPHAQPGFFPVVVALDGGSAGTATTQCTFTYTLKDFLGNVLNKGNGSPATGMTPKRPRPAKGKMVAQPVSLSSHGVAYQDRNGLQLWDAGEVPAVKTCA